MAYYQLATASGVLRIAAVTGRRAGLGAVLGRLDALRPVDRDLLAARTVLRRGLRGFRAGTSSKRPTIAATDDANRHLVRYLRRHAAAGALVPD